MSEQDNEMMLLLKELVNKVKELEKAVYDKDNILMKSGYVVVDSPSPTMGNTTTPTSDNIAKMSWDDIHKMVENVG
tara:strand:+ start:2213 stop:2440 length:228 start_codon:yes stop_codon:yes gene_type:complete